MMSVAKRDYRNFHSISVDSIASGICAHFSSYRAPLIMLRFNQGSSNFPTLRAFFSKRSFHCLVCTKVPFIAAMREKMGLKFAASKCR